MAQVDVEVYLESYSNPDHDDCDGGHCETFDNVCDNIFEFCLREVGSSSCLATITTEDIPQDEFMFGDDELEVLGISNPLQFPDISTSDIWVCIPLLLHLN